MTDDVNRDPKSVPVFHGPTLFANRFYMWADGQFTRIVLGESVSGTAAHDHTAIVMPSHMALELAELINRVLLSPPKAPSSTTEP